MTAPRSLVRAAVRASARGAARSPFDFEDGIHLDFRSGRHYVKAPGAAPVVAPFGTLFAFGRPSSATYRAADGLLRTAASGVPRIEYDSDGTCLGLSMEIGRTNLAIQSEAFESAAWTAANATVTSNSATAPDGTLTADKLVETTDVAAAHRLRPTTDYTIVADTAYSVSVFAKPAERSRFNIRWADVSESNFIESTANLSNATISAGAFGNGSGAVGLMTPYANGWYRVSLVGKIDAVATAARLRLSLADDSGSITYDGDNTKGLYLWGAQVEAASFSSSYIPTTGTTASRSNELATRSLGAEFSTVAGTVAVFGRASPGRESGFAQFVSSFDDGTFNERFSFVRPASSDIARMNILDAGASSATFDFSFVNSASFKGCCAWAVNDFAACFNGSAPLIDGGGTLPTVTTGCLGCGVLGNSANAHIREYHYWPVRRPNTFLQGFSTS